MTLSSVTMINIGASQYLTLIKSFFMVKLLDKKSTMYKLSNDNVVVGYECQHKIGMSCILGSVNEFCNT